MTTASIEKESNNSSDEARPSVVVTLLPYLVLIAAQAPMALWYLKRLWQYEHYQFFPFLMIIVGALAFIRWPKGDQEVLRNSHTSTVLLVLGTGLAVLGAFSFSQSIVMLSVIVLMSGLLARIHDHETGGSLAVLAVPLLLIVRPPFGLDETLIISLQGISSGFTSRILDLLGYRHLLDGNVLIIPGIESCGIERACSGVQSFFTLLFCTLIISVAQRRTFIRSTCLIGSAIFWAVLMNVLRITIIPILDIELSNRPDFIFDLRSGWQHETLGYVVLVLAVLAILSTDYFFEFLLGPIGLESMEGSNRLSKFGTFLWNRFVAGDKKDSEADQNAPAKVATVSKLIWIPACIVVIAGLFQTSELAIGYFSREKSVSSDTQYDAGVSDELIPEKIAGFQKVEYSTESRKGGSIWGETSKQWQYQNESSSGLMSLDYAFARYHDLRICYKSIGWQVVSTESRSVPDSDWRYTYVKLEKPTGEHGLLAFAHFNGSGVIFNNPYEDDKPLVAKIRDEVFASRAYENEIQLGPFYQFQFFMPLPLKPEEAIEADFEKFFLESREFMRLHFETQAAKSAE